MRRFARTVRPETLSAAVVVLMLVAGSVALVRTTAHRSPPPGVAKVAVPPVPSPATATDAPTPAVSAPSAPATLPAERPTVLGQLPVVSRSLPGTPVVKPTVTECVGRMPSGHRAEARCDIGKHQGLPTGCRWDGFCAWWDSWGAVLGGPGHVPITVTPEGDLDISWDIDPTQLQGNEYSGPLKEFVLRVFRDGGSYERLRQYELGVDVRSMTVSGLGPGDYDVCVMELNDSGLGGLCPGTVTIPARSSPTPTSSPTPAASATPTPSPTGTG